MAQEDEQKINNELAKLMREDPGYRLELGFSPGGFNIIVQPYHGRIGGFGSTTAVTTRRANAAAIWENWDATLAEIKEAIASMPPGTSKEPYRP